MPSDLEAFRFAFVLGAGFWLGLGAAYLVTEYGERAWTYIRYRYRTWRIDRRKRCER